MPLLAMMINSVSESIFSAPTTSSESLECLLPVPLPESQANMRALGTN